MVFYVLDGDGTEELKLYKNAQNNSFIYLLPDDQVPNGYNFVEIEKVSAAIKNSTKLQICHLPNQPEFDFQSVALFRQNVLFFLMMKPYQLIKNLSLYPKKVKY